MSLDGVDRSGFELFIRQLPTGFHDAHDCSVEVVFAVVVDGSVRALGFLGLVVKNVQVQLSRRK